MLYLTPLLTTLAYLNGERAVNATTSGPRTDFLQKTLEECYEAYPWRFARATATLTISSGIATLPSNFDISHPVNASYYSSTSLELALEEIDQNDKSMATDGSLQYWLESVPDSNTFVLNTKETTPSNVVVVYQTTAPILAASVGSAYPSAQTVALGARRWVKLGQNPDADISQDEALFQSKLAGDIAAHQVPAPKRTRRTAQSMSGTSTGDF